MWSPVLLAWPQRWLHFPSKERPEAGKKADPQREVLRFTVVQCLLKGMAGMVREPKVLAPGW